MKGERNGEEDTEADGGGVLEPKVLSEKEVCQKEGFKDKDKILQAAGKAFPLFIGLEKEVA